MGFDVTIGNDFKQLDMVTLCGLYAFGKIVLQTTPGLTYSMTPCKVVRGTSLQAKAPTFVPVWTLLVAFYATAPGQW